MSVMEILDYTTLQRLRSVAIKVMSQPGRALSWNDPGVMTATVLLVSCTPEVRTDLFKLRLVTKCPLKLLKKINENARANGIWIGDNCMNESWVDEKNGDIEFVCDVMCLSGTLVRVNYEPLIPPNRWLTYTPTQEGISP